MYILKFGGSSVAGAERVNRLRSIISDAQKKTDTHIIVVVSALQGVTDTILTVLASAAKADPVWRTMHATLSDRHFNLVTELCPVEVQSHTLAATKILLNELEEILLGVSLVREASAKVRDLTISFGERLSASIIASFLNATGMPASYVDAREILVGTVEYGNSRVIENESQARTIARLVNTNEIPVITGFIGATSAGETVTFGRGGSDYTAAVLGALCGASEIQIWTDVDGFLTADPRKVEGAYTIPELSYDEAMELSHFGAKVIYPPTIQPALTKKIPIRILNSFKPDAVGSLISHHVVTHTTLATGVSSIPNLGLIRLQGSGMVGIAGTARRFFAALATSSINVILISQASSEHSICAAISADDADRAHRALNAEFKTEINEGLLDTPIIELELSIVSVVGENMRQRPGVSGVFFSALGKAGVNVIATAQGSSELNISIVIRSAQETRALNAVHDSFFLSHIRTVQLFLCGVGLVGKTLLKQMAAQAPTLREHLGLNLRLCGVTNSRRMSFEKRGLDFSSVVEALDHGAPADLDGFVSEVKRETTSSTIFVDCSASDGVAALYDSLLQNNIAVVAANKRAQSGDWAQYKRMKETAVRRRVDLFFETSVGAGLPVISTLNDLLRSGDTLIRIEGVLSGTLSYIFSRFSSGSPFSTLVAEAKSLGYTEPDPRDDLSGLDVGRKLLILAREAGVEASLHDVYIASLVPQELQSMPDAQQFMHALPQYDNYFHDQAVTAEKEHKKLRYIAALEMPRNGSAATMTVQLTAIDNQHPFWSLDGSDNIISFTTERYSKRPLVIKGPGAGAEVTAAGVFADIIRAAQG